MFSFVSSLEIELLRNLLECHMALDWRLDCIKALTRLIDITDTFDNKLPTGLNSKQTKEVTFIFKNKICAQHLT
jgi:hypothetical protein